MSYRHVVVFKGYDCSLESLRCMRTIRFGGHPEKLPSLTPFWNRPRIGPNAVTETSRSVISKLCQSHTRKL
ncbi:hypothetical protein CC2G_003451 [Coprinopsis cinerea AmutBmut pab1-1]|nr:hypothetical protein CC2G_003451 [Coprinopsis cinerea AmutBmut pab1-1]